MRKWQRQGLDTHLSSLPSGLTITGWPPHLSSLHWLDYPCWTNPPTRLVGIIKTPVLCKPTWAFFAASHLLYSCPMTENDFSSTQLLWTSFIFFITEVISLPTFPCESPSLQHTQTPSPATQNSSAPSCAFLSLFPEQLLLLCVRPALIRPLLPLQGPGLIHYSLSVSHLSTLPPHLRLAFCLQTRPGFPNHLYPNPSPDLLPDRSLIEAVFCISMKF